MADIKAELIDVMGDDLRVANAARVSFDKQSDYEEFELVFDTTKNRYEVQCGLSEKDQRLIKYLAKHKHWTPFSHPMITIRETVPIFVARQRFKHMVGFTYNEVSRRYVDTPPEFYVPDVWRSRPEDGIKQGSGDKPITALKHCPHEWEGMRTKDAYESLLETVEGLYNSLLASGVAPEMARMVLPQSMMTSYYVTGSLYAFANTYRQRIDPHSQKEIQMLAKQWDEIIRPLFPHSWEALCTP